MNTSLPPVAHIDPVKEAFRPASLAQELRKPFSLAFLIAFVAAYALLCLRIDVPASWNWATGVFILMAAATSLVTLARRLPVQNVMWATALIAGLSAVIEMVGVTTGIPFGPHTFTDELGYRIFDTLPWPLPLMWIVLLVNCRGMARLIMRPWRKTDYYGFWVIGLTSLLAVIFDFAAAPYLAGVQRYWIWQTPEKVLHWYRVPWVNFLGFFVTALGIMAFTTPWLINKTPVKQPTDYHPLIIWVLLMLYFATGSALHQQWWAACVGAISATVITSFTIRGARW